MPSLGDSAIIFVLALLLFGPKKLPELARQLGKLMGEFRRASADFRMQMEDELRVSEQAERQKQIASIEAAAPPAVALTVPADNYPAEEHPHIPAAPLPEPEILAPISAAPLPIAISGELSIMPPATGLPVARGPGEASLAPLLQSIPHTPAPDRQLETPSESTVHG